MAYGKPLFWIGETFDLFENVHTDDTYRTCESVAICLR